MGLAGAKGEPDCAADDRVGLAAALDRTQSAGDGLGKFFAERVKIRCGAEP